MKLWIGNIDPQTSDDDLRELLKKYTKFTITNIVRHPATARRPAVMLELEATSLPWTPRSAACMACTGKTARCTSPSRRASGAF